MSLRTIALLLFATAPALATERPMVADKSEIAFTVTQMGVGVSGHFKRFEAKIALDPARPEAGTAEIRVDIASLSTGEAEADAEAQARPWLDVAGFPEATFKSRSVRTLGGNRYEARGLLSIQGRSREITVPFTLEPQPEGALLAQGAFTLRRADFGIGGGEWNEGDLVANEVPVRFRLWLALPR